MALQFSIYIVPLALAAVVSAVFAAIVYRNRENRTAPELFAILFATFIWAGADAMRLAVTEPSSKFLWHNVRFFGSTLVVLAVFLYALQYTGRSRWVSPTSVAVLGSLLAVTNVLAWADHFGVAAADGLIYAGFETTQVGTAAVIDVQYGTWFFVNAAYSYVLLVAAMGMFVAEFLRRSGTYRRQTGGLIVALAVPWAMNGIYLAGYSPIDLTAFGFTVTAVAFFAQFYWFQLLDVVPVARSTAIEHIDAGYLVVDTDRRVLDANEAGAELFGIGPDAAVGRTIEELSEDAPAHVETNEGDVGGDQTVSVIRHGERRYYNVETSPVYDGGEEAIGQVVLIHDVTEQRRQQRTLEERTRELERKNQRLDRFASIVSHDLQNPLTVAEEELRRVDDPGRQPDYERVRDAVDRMDSITQDVLELAREPEAGVDTEPVHLAGLCNRAWDTVDTGDATLVVDTDHTVRADPGRLRQALENLFENAVDHGPPGVTVQVGDLENGFYVADDGPGVPPHLHDQVFEHGFSSDDEATGLGLAIVQSAAEAHGWDVAIETGEDGGARFRFTGVEEAAVDIEERAAESGELVRIGGFVFGDRAGRPASR